MKSEEGGGTSRECRPRLRNHRICRGGRGRQGIVGQEIVRGVGEFCVDHSDESVVGGPAGAVAEAFLAHGGQRLALVGLQAQRPELRSPWRAVCGVQDGLVPGRDFDGIYWSAVVVVAGLIVEGCGVFRAKAAMQG